MGIKVKGVREAQEKLNAVVGDITGRKALRAIHSALIIIGTEAATMTPIATGTLINSQFRDVDFKGTRLTGRIGYSANYAVYVHNAPGKYLGAGKARSVPKGSAKGSLGNIWDATGEPKFLEKGADKTRSQVDAIIKKELSL